MDTGRADPWGRAAWVALGSLACASAIGLLTWMSTLRGELTLRADAHALVDEVASTLGRSGPGAARGELRRLGDLLDRLPPSEARTGVSRAAAAAITAAASGADPELLRQARESLLRLERHLVAEHVSAEASVLRLGVASGLVAVVASFLVLFAGFRGGRGPATGSPPVRPAGLDRLARIVDEAERREARAERFFASLDATVLELDEADRVVRVTSGGPDLFGRSMSEIVGRPIGELLVLSAEDGSPIADWRQPALSGSSFLLRDARGAAHLVSIIHVSDPEHGHTVLIRRSGLRQARLRTFRELEQAGDAALADDRVVALLLGPDNRLARASAAARTFFGILERASSLEPWERRSGLDAILAGEPNESAIHELRDASGRPTRAAVRVSRLRDGSRWIRCLPLEGPLAVVLAPDPTAPPSRPPSDDSGPMPVVVAPREQPGAARPSLLVIDDEPAIGRSLRRALIGIEVVVATDGQDGLRLALAEHDRWDLVLCDIGMPDVDGVRIYAEVRERCPSLLGRLVFMTGALHTERAQAFVERERPPVIAKPFELAAIRAAVAERSATRAAAGTDPPA